jgi:hypothetical protein
MSDQDSTQASETPQTEAPQTQIDLDALAQKIAEIKTEDGRQKYDNVETALESLPHKEEFIDKLKSEVAEERQKREELEKRFSEMETKVSIEDRIADKIASQQGQEERPSGVDFDEQALSDLVARQLDAMDTKKVRRQNADKFVEAVASETKDVEAFINSKATSLGIGEQTFRDLIAQSPDAALKLVGMNSTVPTKTPSNVNTTGFQQKPDEKPPVPKLFSTNSQRTARAEELRAKFEAQIKGN